MSDDSRFESLLREAARTAPVEPPIAPGTVIAGQFEVRGELGRGGMGVVLYARDLRLHREVAIKIMRLDRFSAERQEKLRDSFQREARATAHLSHPNIVTLHHFGEDEGRMYLVLERLHGEGLDVRLARGRISFDEALELALQLTRAVAYAHDMGVIHRDLKPHNIFLESDGRVRVLDFGLATIDEDQEAGAEERGAGTPGYMAPEQLRGEPHDRRTDIWALGACLFELFSGRRPFEDHRSIEDPPRLRDSAPSALDNAIFGALAFDPRARPSDAKTILRVLETLKSGRQRRRWLAAAAAGFLGLAGGLIYLLSRPPAPPELDLEGTWAYTPAGADRVILRRHGPETYSFEFTDAEPGTPPSVKNFYIRGKLILERDAGGKLVLRGDVDDVPGWGKQQVGRMEFDVLAEDRIFMTRSEWGKERGRYTFSYPQWLVTRVDKRPRELGLSEK